MKNKKGKYFEDLISWVNISLHQKAELFPNHKIVDKDTGKLRQIDIFIKINDGPTTVTGIVEIRDRSRKVGVEYVEQILSKKNSVNSDFAIIVSKMGFYNSALKKAANYNIRTFTYEEAITTNWSKAISRDFTFIKESVLSKNLTIYFIDRATKKIIDPSENFIQQVQKEGLTSLVFLTNSKQPFKSMNDLVKIFNSQKAIREVLPVGQQNSVFKRIFIDLNFKDDEKIYFYTKGNKFLELNCLCFIGYFWIEREQIKSKVHHYKDENKVYADIISTKLNGQQIDLLLENPDELSTDKNITIKLNSQQTVKPLK